LLSAGLAKWPTHPARAGRAGRARRCPEGLKGEPFSRTRRDGAKRRSGFRSVARGARQLGTAVQDLRASAWQCQATAANAAAHRLRCALPVLARQLLHKLVHCQARFVRLALDVGLHGEAAVGGNVIDCGNAKLVGGFRRVPGSDVNKVRGKVLVVFALDERNATSPRGAAISTLRYVPPSSLSTSGSARKVPPRASSAAIVRSKSSTPKPRLMIPVGRYKRVQPCASARSPAWLRAERVLRRPTVPPRFPSVTATATSSRILQGTTERSWPGAFLAHPRTRAWSKWWS
jgi:hypothetical protein